MACINQVVQPDLLLSNRLSPDEMPPSTCLGGKLPLSLHSVLVPSCFRLCHMGGVERVLAMALVPTASVWSTRGSTPENSMHINYNSQQEALSATSVRVQETVVGIISGHWTQSSVLGLGMDQLILP